MMVKFPHGYFMDEPHSISSKENAVSRTIQKIQKIAKMGLPTDALVIQLRKKESLSSQERQDIARATNKMEEDPFEDLDDLQRADVAEMLFELLQLILQDHLLEFIQRLELLSSDVKWALYQEIERAGGDLVQLVKAMDIRTVQAQKTPIIQALAQLAELTVTKGARSPYLTQEEIDLMEQDFTDLGNL
ncbi:MAG: hypothetical protein FJZ62_00175 [Chlamydiae bacterium]|nr:hypothetical protein [Chlamydiota bacterium]